MQINKKNKIAVIGGSIVENEIYQLAQETGRKLAEAGFIVYTGGKSGVMEAASSGAKQANGVVVGILPEEDVYSANQYVDIPIATGMGIGRNLILIRSVDAVVAINGKYGTLSEIAFALQLNKPIINLKSWEIDVPMNKAQTPEQVIDILNKILE